MIDIRLRTKVADAAIAELAGKLPGPADFDVLLTGATYVRKPDGKPLCVYLPGALTAYYTDRIYDILHSLRVHTTSNRGHASGTKRLLRGSEETGISKRSEAKPIASTIVGSIDASGARKYCRQTAWTGRNVPEWEELHPLLHATAQMLEHYVPDRFRNQAQWAAQAQQEWIVPGTPFSTITVNNSYPTGVHTDNGDLDEGFSTISVYRKGPYTGGQLVFPQYRVAADLRHGDLILMDAHEWHSNTPLVCQCGNRLDAPCKVCEAERISVVAYLRTNIVKCGTAEHETNRAATYFEGVSGI